MLPGSFCQMTCCPQTFKEQDCLRGCLSNELFLRDLLSFFALLAALGRPCRRKMGEEKGGGGERDVKVFLMVEVGRGRRERLP